MISRSKSTWVGSVLALGLLAGGCTGTSSPPDAEPSAPASLASLEPLLPAATSKSDLTVDRGLAATLDKEFASDEYADLRSVIVLADGRTAYERYYQSQSTDYHQVFSVTKSVISTLIGIAIGEGAIPGVDGTLAELLPDYAGDMTGPVAGTTLQQLLTMMGGFNEESPLPTATDWVASILDKQALDPGTDWFYSDNNAHLAAAVLAEATGMPVLEYARAKLFDPLGIPSAPADQPVPSDPDTVDGANFGWAIDPQGINVGGYGLRLRAQDMAKIGLLYLHAGVWDGQQVVPADWIDQATTMQSDNDYGGYGYLWWVGQVDDDPGYSADGNGGQRIFVIPNRELVVVYQVWTDPAVGNQAQDVEGKLDEAFVELIAPAYKA